MDNGNKGGFLVAIKIIALVIAFIVFAVAMSRCGNDGFKTNPTPAPTAIVTYTPIPSHEPTTEATETPEPSIEPTAVPVAETEQPVASTNAAVASNAPADNEVAEESEVWVSSNGEKYHKLASCSNMTNPTKISKTEAEKQGYTPCKKCY